VALTNPAGDMYSKFDIMLKELSEQGEASKKPKKFSGGGLLVKTNPRNTTNVKTDERQEQFKIPLMVMSAIRKRREKYKNGII
tara:strand:+ start:1109 stop:1357 length:249 start_codon:yes stop_codon:yes gene_type:complete